MKTRFLCATLAGVLIALRAAAAPGLPADAHLDPAIPAPAEVLGFAPGERHPRHDEVLRYFEVLAAASDRVRVEVIGETHGGRPLLLAYFSRPDRLRDLDALRAARGTASREGAGPPVIWLGYSVHGNEASGTSAALVVAWHLAASQSPEVKAWLDELVIVMEPVLNPDGLDRFAHWVNAHRGRHPSADPLDREHNEAWPNGRTNYYWFDLNRDWLPLTQPESRARLRHYHAWRPHVVTDVHEMWDSMTYFFQPGVPERNNPLIPAGNLELTQRLAEHHGEILDAAGEPLFTREVFDDYYVGKGSTYPDVTGGVGILFEQGTSRGHRIDTPFGERTFSDAIANQVRTSISTLRGSRALAAELLAYQAGFYRDSAAQARRASHAGWLLGDGGDPQRARALIELLLGHDIEVRPVSAEVEIDGRRHPPGSAWFIPAGQDRYLLLRSIFEVSDAPVADAFYDVSAWPLQHAFRLPLAEARRAPANGAPLAGVPAHAPPPLPAGTPAAWLVPWAQLNAPVVLAALLADGYRVQVATQPLTAATPGGSRELGRGTLVIHPGIQDAELPPTGERLRALSAEHGVEIVAARRGLSLAGIDLGGPAAPILKAPKVALLVGDHLDPYTAGDTWHWFDMRLQQPLTQLDWPRMPADLRGYTHIVLPGGDYSRLPDFVGERLVAFVQGGGQLIALRRAATWVESLPLEWEFADATPGEEPSFDPAGRPVEGETVVQRPYGEFRADHARAQVGGSVLRIALDVTHPLGFGYEAGELSVMRSGWHRLRPVRNPYAQPATYLDPPLVAGFLSPQNRARLAGSPSLAATRHGPGLVVRMADDPLFRGYWRGTEMLFANALFFGSVVGETRLPALEPDPTQGGR